MEENKKLDEFSETNKKSHFLQRNSLCSGVKDFPQFLQKRIGSGVSPSIFFRMELIF